MTPELQEAAYQVIARHAREEEAAIWRAQLAAEREGVKRYAEKWRQVEAQLAETSANHLACDSANRAEVERLRMQLAACGVVAMANTPETAAQAREMHPDFRSASCDDVARAVDEQMLLRAKLKAVVEAVRVLSDCTYWENMVAFQPAMSPSERDALLTLIALAAAHEKP